jgi:hypothetical protein
MLRLRTRRKYGNRVVRDRDGQTFDSAGELARWRELVLLQSAGVIRELRRQVPIELEGRDGPLRFDNGRKARVVVDFVYVDVASGATCHEDFKGWETPVSRLKRAVRRAMGIEVRLERRRGD